MQGRSTGFHATTRRRSFVLVGGRAEASGDFRLEDLPSTSGRLDVLARALRAGLLVSHGVRQDVVVYLVLRGGPKAPRVLRVEGAAAKFLRPDERSMAVLVQKALTTAEETADGFCVLRHGVAVAKGDLDVALEDAQPDVLFVLEQTGADVRDAVSLDAARIAFVVGDPTGFDEGTRADLARLGARPLSVGPRDLHAEDVVTLLANELDRRDARAACAS
jgi:tRNA (pseudouridine54-N1)-methyltransferase